MMPKTSWTVWNKHLMNKLVKELKFVQSKSDGCVVERGSTMYPYSTPTTASILAGPNEKVARKKSSLLSS